MVLAKHEIAPWWWFLLEPKHVGATVGILIVLIFLWFYIRVRHVGTIRSALILLMHGTNMKTVHAIQLTASLLNTKSVLLKQPSFIYRSNGYLLREIQVLCTKPRGKRWLCTNVLARGTRGYKRAPSCVHCNQNMVNQLIIVRAFLPTKYLYRVTHGNLTYFE